MRTLCNRAMNLDQNIGGVNALKWFRAMSIAILETSLDCEKACLLSTFILLDPSILMPVWNNAFEKLYKYQTKFSNSIASDFLLDTFNVFHRNNALPKLIDL